MKKLIIILAVILGVGVIIGATGCILASGNIEEQIFMEKKETYTANEGVIVDCSTNDVIVKTGSTSEVIFEYYETEKLKPTITRDGGNIKFESDKKREFFFFNWFTRKTAVTVTLPKNFSGNLSLSAKTGTITVKDLKSLDVKTLYVSVTTGEIEASGIKTSDNAKFKLTTGSATIDDLTVGGAADISSTTGRLSINKLEAAGNVKVSATTGRITAENVKAGGEFSGISTTGKGEYDVDSQKVTLKASTGEIKFRIANGKNISVNVTTGDIEGVIVGDEQSYSVDCRTTTGDSNISNRTGGENTLKVETSTGDVNIKFEK